MFLEMLILIAVLMGLVPVDGKKKKESPGERRAKDKAFRKDRSLRAERNRGPTVDENGNMVVPRHIRESRYRKAMWYIRSNMILVWKRILSYKDKQKIIHERYKTQIWFKEHRVEYTVCLIALFGIYCAVMFHMFGNYAIFMGITPICVGAAVSPYEILNTGIVSVEDFAEESGNHTDVEIQAALTYQRENGKGCILLSPVDWEINDTILVGHNETTSDEGVHIIGGGMNRTKLISNINDTSKFVIKTDYTTLPPSIMVYHFYVSDLTITGNATTYGGIWVNGVHPNGAYIENVRIEYFSYANSIGLYASHTFKMAIRDSLVNAATFGISLNRVNNADIVNTGCVYCANTGFYVGVDSYNNTLFKVNASANTSGGININRGWENVVDNSYIEANGQYGIVVDQWDVTSECYSNVIRRTYFDGLSTSEYGIAIRANNTIIEDNSFKGHTAGSIVLGRDSIAWETNWNHTLKNYMEDPKFVRILGNSTCKWTWIEENEWMAWIDDSGTYTLMPGMVWCRRSNGSGGNLVYGDVVVENPSSSHSVTTTTAAGDPLVFGVVYDDTKPNGYQTYIVRYGYVSKRVKVNGVVDIAVGDFLETHTDAGIAQKGTVGSGACFAIAREAYTNDDSNGTIQATLITPR